MAEERWIAIDQIVDPFTGEVWPVERRVMVYSVREKMFTRGYYIWETIMWTWNLIRQAIRPKEYGPPVGMCRNQIMIHVRKAIRKDRV